MSFNKENLEKSFQSLSTRYGGSLLSEKQLLHQEEVVVFIGLGGLGGRAVNAIKASSTEKLDNPDRRFFLVVDTCEEDMNEISIVTEAAIENPEQADFLVRGCIEEHEKLPLYKDTYKIKTLGHDIDSWLNRKQLDEVSVDNKGAQGIRQIGRVMLMAKGNYEVVYRKLSGILEEAKNVAISKNVAMKIYIIAGISGGTGSGTIVDFSYMVKRAISGFDPKFKMIDAVLFAPDVQFNDRGIDENKKKGLKANFYAAMKEVDFFFNNHARTVSYKCPYSADLEVYKEDIFDACTVVSRRAQGVDIAANSNGVLKRVADALTFEISGIKGKTNTGEGQSYSSFFSNVFDNFKHWWPDNSYGQGLDMPDWAPSRYSSLAYSSFYVPRDELIAYCANLLMERLADQWKKNDITENELTEIFRKYSIISNKAFAGKIFELADCRGIFDVDKKELPVDGFGLAKVKNCESYLEYMRYIAEQEGTKQKAKMHLNKAKPHQDKTFTAPIISLVDKAFTDGAKGPVYAINLLSAGTVQRNSGKTGVLAQLRQLISALSDDAATWELELEQVYSGLITKAQDYDGLISIDVGELESYTNDCRQYGEDLLKCKILSQSSTYLAEIYESLNDKNNKVFQIYTYAFEYLVKMLKQDSQYVTDTQRHRDGQTTVFTFDLADFRENDRNSNRFKSFFKSFVDTKNLTAESKIFVDTIFKGLKETLDPVDEKEKPGDIKPKDVINIIRGYFKTSFSDFKEEVIEKFCVIAYSDVEITPERLTEIWENPEEKAVVLQKAADAIKAKIMNERKIMLSCADVTKDLQNFCSYETFAALKETVNINNNLDNPFVLQANWSEFIGFMRIFGFPISLLADLSEYKKAYDAQVLTAGIHLDEMYSEDDGFGDWRYSLPEPYSYPTAKLLKKYTEGGRDTTEIDKQHMSEILNLAIKAKELGLLFEKRNDHTDADKEKSYADNGQTYYELAWKLITDIDDFEGKKAKIYEDIRTAVKSYIDDKKELDFFGVLNRAGYKCAERTEIQWTFVRPEFNVMRTRTTMGDDVDFGNLIILIRSNPYWEVQLRKGVKLFGNLREIYDAVLGEFTAADKYNERFIQFMKAIRVGRIVPFYDSKIFTGYRIKVSDASEEDVTFVNSGLDAFDKNYLMYLFFTEEYLKLEDSKYTPMNTLIEHDFSREKHVDFSAEARENVKWFIKEADAIITDKTLLAHYDFETVKKKFREKLKYSKFSYSLPEPSNNRENVEAVIGNLKLFYSEIRKNLSENLPKDEVADDKIDTSENNITPVQADNNNTSATWKCSCGTENTRNFCQNCGKKKDVVSDETWTCSFCGTKNTRNFCQNCGKQKPVSVKVWKCSCGTENTGKFCQGCGKQKPAGEWTCSCGTKNTGKFCQGCGKPLN